MRKLIAALLLLASCASIADAGIISRPTKTTGGTSFNDGTIPHASDFNGDADTVYSLVNGALDNANVAVAANIAGTKILPQFTANVQVTTGASPCFVNIDSSLGADLKQWRICQNAGVLSIATYTDAGAVIITPMSIVRATGNVTISSLTANSFLYSGTAGLLTTTAAPTNGQLLIGSTGAAPVRAALTGTANEITVTNGAGTITLDIPTGAILNSATATADPGAALGLATKQYVDAQVALLIPSGTIMVMQQTSCPSGWTKGATHNNKALRLVTGTVTTAGSVAFTTAFAAGSIPAATGSHTLTTAESPAHTHDVPAASDTIGAGSSLASPYDSTPVGAATTTTSSGGGGGHTHTIAGQSLDVQYVDVVLCSKD